MTTHECGCSFFGPGPHPVDARHRNARGCEHAEAGLDVAWSEAEAAVPVGWKLRLVFHPQADDPHVRYEARIEKSVREWNGDDQPHVAWAASPVDALRAALGAAQEKGEAG